MNYHGKRANEFYKEKQSITRPTRFEEEAGALLNHVSDVFNKKHLLSLIDQSLDLKDKDTFLQLTNEYNNLVRLEQK
ncbi:IDEAL domain-containing protein [Bacillus sp. CGMCC 1.16541]|uniref:IDEAL domain-containing protein n=1 Tax=Bacillus sp. CGMCC 1.16541 TaxID=2185143 RepID=UPI000D73393E|nr:IDEAL domain-containing protein [Bacillus sp. CGMCC 1.16541]